MGCIAQRCDCTTATCPVPEPGQCMPFVDADGICAITVKEVKCCFIRGEVTCNGQAIGGAIVFATNSSNQSFAGLTNTEGKYCICVPSPESARVEYDITCHCCPDCCFPADCICCQ